MIVIDRNAYPEPEILSSSRAEKVRQETAAYFSVPLPERKRERDCLPGHCQLLQEIVPVLRQMFYNKCAFCETPLRRDYAVGGFRPESFALNLDGEMAPDYYYWLSLEWENLYIGCDNCWRIRRSRFPVKGPCAAQDMDLSKEQYLLLDPCHDYPGHYLLFSQNGQVASKKERGQVTIEVFGLNRDDLVEARRKAYKELQNKLCLLGQYSAKGESLPPDLSMAIVILTAGLLTIPRQIRPLTP